MTPDYEHRIRELERKIEVQQTAFADFEKLQAVEENRRLRAGIKFIGGAFIALAGVAWAFRKTIIGGGL